jgi:hypothetical protein
MTAAQSELFTKCCRLVHTMCHDRPVPPLLLVVTLDAALDDMRATSYLLGQLLRIGWLQLLDEEGVYLDPYQTSPERMDIFVWATHQFPPHATPADVPR